jgi:hypothetical protein
MSDKPQYLTEEWLQENRTIFSLHDPDRQGPVNRWWAQVYATPLSGASEAECKQIAHLMRAAPKLLEALIHCHDWILSQQTEAKEGESVRLEARAVIAEATGGEE